MWRGDHTHQDPGPFRVEEQARAWLRGAVESASDLFGPEAVASRECGDLRTRDHAHSQAGP